MTNPWVLLGLVVSAAMIAGTPFLWRRRGAVSGLRWLAVALLPGGLALTGLLTLFGRVGNAVASFFTGTAFSPVVWIGYAAIGAAMLVWLVAGAIAGRGGRTTAARVGSSAVPPAVAPAGRRARSAGIGSADAPPAAGDDFAEIEAILKRRGI